MTPLAKLALLFLLPGRIGGQTLAPASPWQVKVAEQPGMQSFPLAPDVLGSSGKEFTVEIHLREGALERAGPLLRVIDKAAQPVLQLEVAPRGGGAKGEMLRFEVTTDFKPKPLVLGVPTQLLLATEPRDVVLRDLGFRLDLLVDGVLVDQEWPTGKVAAKGARVAEASSGIGDVRISAAVLPDAVLLQQSGGEAAVARREQKMFGSEATSMQYWRPRGYNTSAGDAMPFFHDGVLHVFYLMDRRHHQSKWGLGAHQWGHKSTTDLVHWKTYPPALTIEHEWEASICTGSVFYRDGRFYAFYATRMPDRSEHLDMAVSEDGIRFKKLVPSPFDEPRPPYRRGPNRDPFVFGEANDVHMLVTASLLAPAVSGQAGALEELRSTDLKRWTVEPAPFLVTGYPADPECSDLFLWHGWYYLLFSENGQAHYRMSRSRAGPWTRPKVDVLDGVEARVMKTASFTGDRRIGVAFVPDGDFGGHLVFRELLQSPDGTLESTFPREMTPHGTTVQKTAQVWMSSEGTKVEQGGLLLDGRHGPAAAELRVPSSFILRATLAPGAVMGRFGFRLGRSSGDLESGSAPETLEIDPSQGRVAWAHSPSTAGLPVMLETVDGLGGPIKIELVVQGSIADLDVNGRHTLVHRLRDDVGGTMSVFCDGGDLRVTDLELEALGQSE